MCLSGMTNLYTNEVSVLQTWTLWEICMIELIDMYTYINVIPPCSRNAGAWLEGGYAVPTTAPSSANDVTFTGYCYTVM